MNDNTKQLTDIFFIEPETKEEMIFASEIQINNDGSFSFEMANKDNTVRYKHTIKSVQVL